MENQQPQASVNVFKSMGEIFYWLKRVGVRPHFFFLSVVFTAASVFFNFFGLRLFISLLRGLIQGHFTLVKDKLGLVKHVVAASPEFFSSSRNVFLFLMGLILLSTVAKNILTYFATLFINRQVVQADKNLRQLLFDRFLNLGKFYYDTSNIANVSHMILNTSGSISGQIGALKTLFTQLLSLTAYLGIMFWISWKLTIAAFLIFPAQHFFSASLVRRIRNLSIQRESTGIDLSEKIFNVFSCITLVKAYANENRESRRLNEFSDKEIETADEIQRKQLLIRPIEEINTILSLLMIVLVMTFVAPAHESHQISSYLVFFYVARMAMPNFGAIVKFKFSLAAAEGALKRIRTFLTDGPNTFVICGDKEFSGMQQGIEVRDLNFSYKPGVPVLKNISFTVEKGKTTAIIGSTGAGKSTIVQLLMRFYNPESGEILIDGRDVRQFTLESMAKHLSFVGQEPMLFNDTLRENLVYGLRDPVSDETVFEALEKAELGDFRKLANGLDTMIGDRGIQLSGGERQRLMIARAFLKGADILILDEATSALDSKTEKKIQNAVNEAISGRTAIVIAHRLSTIMNADKIIVIEKGCLIEQGSPKDLLERRGAFYEHWKAQECSYSPENLSGDGDHERGDVVTVSS
jgi:subfamily B ATP-binding cassette protein MsbA